MARRPGHRGRPGDPDRGRRADPRRPHRSRVRGHRGGRRDELPQPGRGPDDAGGASHRRDHRSARAEPGVFSGPAGRAAPDLRGPGGDRDRERPALHRARRPQPRSHQRPRAADRDRRRAERHERLRDRRPAGLRRDRAERGPPLPRAVRARLSAGRRRDPLRHASQPAPRRGRPVPAHLPAAALGERHPRRPRHPAGRGHQRRRHRGGAERVGFRARARALVGLPERARGADHAGGAGARAPSRSPAAAPPESPSPSRATRSRSCRPSPSRPASRSRTCASSTSWRRGPPQLTRSVGELQALGEVSQAVSSTLDLDAVLETIVGPRGPALRQRPGRRVRVRRGDPDVPPAGHPPDDRRSTSRRCGPRRSGSARGRSVGPG